MRTCASCGTENSDQASFCRACGGALPGAPQSDADPGTCASCGSELRPGATFCPACGAVVQGAAAGVAGGDRKRLFIVASAAAAVVLGIGVVLVAFLLLGGDDDDGRVDSGLVFAEPVALSDQAKTDLQSALDALPDPVGDTDAEQLRSVLGPPDVFQLWFEPLDGGGTARSETWYYLDLEVSYEFRDGVLLFTIPMDEVPGLVLVPLRYDPLDFSEATTVDDVRAMLDDPASLIPEETPADYELGVTVWAGEQVMAAFDENGELLYVETVAMDLGDGS